MTWTRPPLPLAAAARTPTRDIADTSNGTSSPSAAHLDDTSTPWRPAISPGPCRRMGGAQTMRPGARQGRFGELTDTPGSPAGSAGSCWPGGPWGRSRFWASRGPWDSPTAIVVHCIGHAPGPPLNAQRFASDVLFATHCLALIRDAGLERRAPRFSWPLSG